MKFIKQLSTLVLIDFIAIALSYSIVRFLLNQVKNYYQEIQSFTESIDKVGITLQKNSSLLNINELSSNLDIINQMSNYIISLIFLLFVSIFIIYIITQSISWNLIINNFKLTDFKNYLKRFFILSIAVIAIISYLFFIILSKLKPFILDFWFNSYFNTKEFLIILVFISTIFLIKYLTINLYILINKHNIKISLNKLKNLKLYYYLPQFISALIISFLIFIFIVRFNPNSTILIIFSTIIFLIPYNLFKMFLVKKTKFY